MTRELRWEDFSSCGESLHPGRPICPPKEGFLFCDAQNASRPESPLWASVCWGLLCPVSLSRGNMVARISISPREFSSSSLEPAHVTIPWRMRLSCQFEMCRSKILYGCRAIARRKLGVRWSWVSMKSLLFGSHQPSRVFLWKAERMGCGQSFHQPPDGLAH